MQKIRLCLIIIASINFHTAHASRPSTPIQNTQQETSKIVSNKTEVDATKAEATRLYNNNVKLFRNAAVIATASAGIWYARQSMPVDALALASGLTNFAAAYALNHWDKAKDSDKNS